MSTFTTLRLVPPTFLLAAVLASPGAAQQREFPPLSESVDIKTAPEPSRPPDPVAARPATPASGPMQGSEAERRPARAVDPRAPFQGPWRVDHSRMHYDTPGDGSLWARGASYKASFDAAGATCFPLFGGLQPRHLPLALSPDLVTLGGMPLATSEAPTTTRSSDRVEIDRGTYVERYELAPQSLEQIFVFDALGTEGDLSIRIPIAPAEETIEVEPTPDGLTIRSELGTVHYSRAVAIDGRGRRAEAETTFAGGAITIRVDAEFLAAATMPLVVDPVVTPVTIDTSSFDDQGPDVAYDASTQRWLVVFAETATAGDQDVYYVMCNAAGATMWGGYVNSNNASWWYANCANLNSADQFLVVCNVNATGGYTIRGRTIQANIASIGNEFLISGSESGDKRYPDVGGDPWPSAPAYYCVAYERVFSSTDHDILVRLVAPDSTLVGTSANFLSNSGGTYDTQPSVAKSNNGGNWMIAWARTPSSSSSDIWAGSITYSGATALSPFQVTSGNYDYYAAVSSPLAGSGRNLIAFLRDYGTDFDVYAYVQQGATAITSANISTLHNDAYFTRDQRFPNVDSDGTHFLLGYSEQKFVGSYDYDVYVDELYLGGNLLGLAQTHVALATATAREEGPRLASTWGSGGANKRYLAAWSRETTPINHDILGALFDGTDTGSASAFCFGDGTGLACPCGNNGTSGHGCASSTNPAGASLSISGSLMPAYDTAVLSATGMPATAGCLFFQSSMLVSPSLFGDGLRCTGGTVVRIGSKTAAAGTASYPGAGDAAIHVKGGVPLAGGQRTYQCWYRNTAVFCTSAPYNLTNGVVVNWAN